MFLFLVTTKPGNGNVLPVPVNVPCVHLQPFALAVPMDTFLSTTIVIEVVQIGSSLKAKPVPVNHVLMTVLLVHPMDPAFPVIPQMTSEL